MGCKRREGRVAFSPGGLFAVKTAPSGPFFLLCVAIANESFSINCLPAARAKGRRWRCSKVSSAKRSASRRITSHHNNDQCVSQGKKVPNRVSKAPSESACEATIQSGTLKKHPSTYLVKRKAVTAELFAGFLGKRRVTTHGAGILVF